MSRVLPAVLVLLLFASAASAHPENRQQPPEFGAAGKDTLWLNSGERLIGEILLFRDETLEFDSEELDEQKFETEDIAGWRSPRVLTCTFRGNVTAIGPAVLVDGVVRIRTTEGVREFPRGTLESVIEGVPNELNLWGARATAGFSGRAGNTDQVDLNTMVRLRREATRSRFDVTYTANFSQVDSVETINNQKGNLGLNYFVRRGVFVTPLFLEAYTDRFQNIELRYTVGAGGGLFIIRSAKRDFYVQFGVGYRVIRNTSVAAGKDPRESTTALIPQVTYEEDITSDIELSIEYSGQVGVPDLSNTTHHGVFLLSVDLLGDTIDFTSSLTWDRIETPRADDTGRVPVRDDFRTQIGLTVDF